MELDLLPPLHQRANPGLLREFARFQGGFQMQAPQYS